MDDEGMTGHANRESADISTTNRDDDQKGARHGVASSSIPIIQRETDRRFVSRRTRHRGSSPSCAISRGIAEQTRTSKQDRWARAPREEIPAEVQLNPKEVARRQGHQSRW